MDVKNAIPVSAPGPSGSRAVELSRRTCRNRVRRDSSCSRERWSGAVGRRVLTESTVYCTAFVSSTARIKQRPSYARLSGAEGANTALRPISFSKKLPGLSLPSRKKLSPSAQPGSKDGATATLPAATLATTGHMRISRAGTRKAKANEHSTDIVTALPRPRSRRGKAGPAAGFCGGESEAPRAAR